MLKDFRASLRTVPGRARATGVGLALACVLPLPAFAASASCSVAALSAYGVPGVTIQSATDVPASVYGAEFCDVVGTLTTHGEGAPDGSAGFQLWLPVQWNHKFVFWGVGGLAGSTYADFAANPVDFASALPKGYATAITDTGHQAGNTDAAWALESTGVPNEATLTDYYHRATHEVALATKQLIKAYYAAASIEHSYFDGCSNGGRQAMVEATRYPEDFDGIIAGAPFMDIRTIIAGAKFQKVQLHSPVDYIPASMLPIIDQAVYASCDAADGVQDGLIQNPAHCSFDPKSLICKPGQASNCLTPGQARTLDGYISALRDERGRLIYTGASITDLSGGMDVWSAGLVAPTDFSANEPWGGTGFAPAPVAWQFVDHIMKDIYARDASYDMRSFPVSRSGIVDDAALRLFDQRTRAGNGDSLQAVREYARRGGRLILFHGLSDPALPPFRTVHLYEQLAGSSGGYADLQRNVRLFLVPGMQHCVGGPGPNVFDTLSALEGWVEAGTAPDGILAAHFVGNDTSKPIDRTMPLCKFPEQAEYKGSGAYADGANWSCTDNHRMLELGRDGLRAGLGDRDHDGDDR